jgi:methionyl-tRNA synthetase
LEFKERNACLHETAESIRLIAILLLPFIPNSANKILDLLNVDQNQRNFQSLNNKLKSCHQINEPSPIFPRIGEIIL